MRCKGRNQDFIMAERGDEISDGSDIEADYEEEDGNIDELARNINREVNHGDVDEWILNIFYEDDEENGEFLGFQNE